MQQSAAITAGQIIQLLRGSEGHVSGQQALEVSLVQIRDLLGSWLADNGRNVAPYRITAVSGESSRMVSHEVSDVAQYGSYPFNTKKGMTLFEARGQSGVLTFAGLELNADNPDISEDLGIIELYVDDEIEPVVSCPVTMFFMGGFDAPECYVDGKFTRFRTNYTDAFGSGQTIYPWIPFQEYARIDYYAMKPDVEASPTLWSMIGALRTPSFITQAPFRRFEMATYINDAQPVLERFLVADLVGPGVLTHLTLNPRFTGGDGEGSWIEGDTIIVIDDDPTSPILMPRWGASGNEDLSNGAFGIFPPALQPGGGIFAPSIGDRPAALQQWRFLDRDPVRYERSCKVYMQLGQRDQSTLTGTRYVRASVGAYSDNLPVPHYYRIGDVLLDEQFDYPAGALPAPWVYPGAQKFLADGLGNLVVTDAAATDTPVCRPLPANVGPNYVIDMHCLISQDSGVPEVFLGTHLPDNGGFLGQGSWVELSRPGTYDWRVARREDFAAPQADRISRGESLLNVPVVVRQMCFESIGGQSQVIAGYWKFEAEADTEWRAIGRCQSAHPTQDWIGFDNYFLAGKVSRLVIRDLNLE